MPQLPGKVICGCMGGNLVVLDSLGRADQREICCILFFGTFINDFLSLFNRAHHPLARPGRGGFTQQREAFVEPLDVGFALGEIFLEQPAL